MNVKKTSAFSAIFKLYRIFNDSQKRKFQWITLLTFISSITDILGLASIIPVVGLVLTDAFHDKLMVYLPFLDGYTKDQLLLIIVAFFLFVIILKNLFGLYVNKLQTRFVEHMYVSSTMNVLNKIYKYELPEINKVNSSVWINKLSTLQMQLASNVAISTMIIINEAMVFSLTAIIVCIWNWHLFLILIIVLFPAIGIFYMRVKNLIKAYGIEKNKSFVNLYNDAQEMIFGYTDIKISGMENFFKKRFETIAKRFSRTQGKTDFIMFIPTRIIEVVIFVCIVIILLYGVFVLKDMDKIVTTISLFSVIAYRSIPSVNRFIVALNTITVSEYILNDSDFMATPIPEVQKDITPMKFEQAIHFKDVSYRYAGANKEVISHCNLHINRGDKVGIVGKSGSGKSTLINNILGFLKPTSGSIVVDEIPLTEENIESWWKIIGYVRQDVFIMNTTLLENIAIGEDRSSIDMIKMDRAIRLSSLTDLVNDLPDGINTILSEQGNNLSGGQKQRVAIARVIYNGAQVLIFDEATSALDSKTEIEVTESINQLGGEHLTIIIIAHRFTSLRYCDKIYKLDEGVISDTYSYAELLKSDN